MSVTASQLSKSGARGKDLDAAVREHLQMIDDRLQRADRTWGRNVVVYDLPMSLSLPGLNKSDAQRILYSMLIRSLDRRGFETKLFLTTERCALFIAWMTDLDVDELAAMNALIRAKRISSDEDIAAFVVQGSAAAPRSATAARQGRAPPVQPMKMANSGVMQPRGGIEPPGARAEGAQPGGPQDARGLTQAEAALLSN
jgi:hypothetical protein